MAQTRAFHMPLHHLHLVPEHQELDVLLILQATSGSEQTGDEEVHEREQHGAPSGRRERMLPVALGAGLGFLNPSGAISPSLAGDQLRRSRRSQG